MKILINTTQITPTDKLLIAQKKAVTYDISCIFIMQNTSDKEWDREEKKTSIIQELRSILLIKEQNSIYFSKEEWDAQLNLGMNKILMQLTFNPSLKLEEKNGKCRKLYLFLKELPSDEMVCLVEYRAIISSDEKERREAYQLYKMIESERINDERNQDVLIDKACGAAV